MFYLLIIILAGLVTNYTKERSYKEVSESRNVGSVS